MAVGYVKIILASPLASEKDKTALGENKTAQSEKTSETALCEKTSETALNESKIALVAKTSETALVDCRKISVGCAHGLWLATTSMEHDKTRR